MKVLTILMFLRNTYPTPSVFNTSKKPTNNPQPRSGELTLIAAIDKTPLADFIQNKHPNGEGIEAGLLQLGEHMLPAIWEHLSFSELTLRDTFFSNYEQDDYEDSLKRLLNITNNYLPEHISYLNPPNELLNEHTSTKELRIVGDDGYNEEDLFNFYLQPAIGELQPTLLVMKADIFDENAEVNIELEKSLFSRMLTHLLRNNLISEQDIKAMAAYENEYLAEQGKGYKPMVTTENQVVLKPFGVIA